VYRDFITFTTTERIAGTALALLNSPESRWEMERRGLQFMLQDHFQPNVSVVVSDKALSDGSDTTVIEEQTSSLTLLANALSNLAGM
jgi:hypothetical protein